VKKINAAKKPAAPSGGVAAEQGDKRLAGLPAIETGAIGENICCAP